MKKQTVGFGAMAIAMLTSAAGAAPSLTSLGTGTPFAASNPQAGVLYVTGQVLSTGTARWTINGSTLSLADLGGAAINGQPVCSADGTIVLGSLLNSAPQIMGNAATGVSPAFSTTPTLVPTAIPATETVASYWNSASSSWTRLPGIPVKASQMVYGQGSSSGGGLTMPYRVSNNGRFIVGRAYISNYNSAAGTTIAIATSTWRPYIFDRDANGGAGEIKSLITPMRTSSNTWRRRTGEAYAVSNDGKVVIGAQEHNVATTPTADPDGARLICWRLNEITGEYDMSYLPSGVNGSGFPYTVSVTAGSTFINAAGTIVVGRATDNDGNTFIGKWIWNAGTQTWNQPIVIGTGLPTQASWLPLAVTSCAINQPLARPTVTATGMSDDGNTIVGSAVYSTCGSFMSGGFIWTASSGEMKDWYDYCVSRGVSDVTSNYGPIGDNNDPTKGLPKLGYPVGISSDGTVIVGAQLGTQRIPGAPPWVFQDSDAAPCVSPVITGNPTAAVPFSRCTSLILNCSAAGTGVTFQWMKNGQPLTDGITITGSTILGATTTQLRINNQQPGDAGTYNCVVTGACGTPASSTNAVLTVDPAVTTPNDTCANAQEVGEGTFNFAPCGAWTDETVFPSCLISGTETHDVWFRYTPTITGDVRFETCGSNYDTIVSLHSGCGGFELACNDDYVTGPSTSCSSTRSRVARYSVTSGQPIYVRVALKGFFSTTSAGQLKISAAPAESAGNNCSSPIAAVIGANPLDTNEATNDGIALCAPASIVDRDVWYAFTPSAKGYLKASTCPGTTWNTVISVRTSCGGSDIACNDNAVAGDCATGTSNQSMVKNVEVDAGTQYLIRVGGNSATAFGTGTMTLAFVGKPCQPADIAYDNGVSLKTGPMGVNGGVNEGDYNSFFQGFFTVASNCDIANDDGTPLPPFGTVGTNGGVNEGDYNCFFQNYFSGCP